ncbi:branched-chain amino acid ABC transporter permease [Bacillus sp. Marseille-P3661]|uniref:branched-chain amino acid ABC transporter permease n=1 Tax=Bacillus sp. Marseille-P3661 TaxID=1936234 RepID=UPI000C828115|nr:branched-chain amino acid ABC transporter permease [Bacillus sp. Marseille-P3661]
METLIGLLIQGLATGSLYALLAVGFGLIYNATQVFHIAHGATFVIGTYFFYTSYVIFQSNIVVSFVIALLGSAIYGVALERFIYRPLRNKGASIVMTLIASLGILILTENLIGLIFGPDTYSIFSGPLPTINIGNNFMVTITDILAIVIAVIVFIILYFVLTKSKIGKMMRAISDNPEMATIVGMNTNKIYTIVFAIGSALVALAAPLQAMAIGVRPDQGFSIMFVSVIAVIIGGIGYLPGAALGALFLGIIESLSLWVLPSSWKTTVVFIVMLLFLVIKPQGFFGSKIGTRRA